MKKFKINKGLVLQKLENKNIIFDGEESILYTFNETASFIFHKIKSGWDNSKIISILIKKYGINKNKATQDLTDYIQDLLIKKIITS